MHRILAIGAIMVLALAVSGQAAAWTWPADGAVLRPFALGADAYAAGQHRGIDVTGPDGSTVRAPAAGTVSFAGSLPTYGRGVTILTADGYAVTLVHLGTIEIAKGDTVGEGATVGTMGASGTPEQEVPSVHLGIRRASDEEGYLDPLGLLPPRAAPAPSATQEPLPAPVATAAPVAARPPSPPAPSSAVAPSPAPATPTAPVTTPTAPPAMSSPPTSPASAAQAAVAPVQQVARQAGVAIESSSPPGAVPAAADSAVPAGPETSVTSAAPFQVGVPAARSGAASTHAASTATSASASASSDAPAHQAVGGRVSAVRPAAAGPQPVRPVAHEPSHVSEGSGRMRNALTRSVAHARPEHGRSAIHAVVEDREASVVADAALAGPRPLQAREARHDPSIAAGGLGVRKLAAGIALIALLVVAVGRWAARRIGMDGAVLRHHADLLRQLDATHRPRLHDRGRGRVRPPSATART